MSEKYEEEIKKISKDLKITQEKLILMNEIKKRYEQEKTGKENLNKISQEYKEKYQEALNYQETMIK